MALQPDDVKERVRDASPIDQIIVAWGIPLKRAGRKFKGLCPFHPDHNPSMEVDVDRQRYRCWSCGANGDVFEFVMQREGIEFPEALAMLAERAGIPLVEHRSDPQAREKAARRREQKRYLYRLNQAAQEFYRKQLFAPVGQAALGYLEDRGISPEMIETFGLGFAPAGNALLREFGQGDARQRAMVAAGLARARDNGRISDWFYNRLMFPIRDVKGDVVGFSGRALGDEKPKYINTSETPLFRKKQLLYNLDRARSAPDSRHHVIVVEGYTDVIMCVQHGVENVVAAMGLAFGEETVRDLKRHTAKIVLMFDGDERGQERIQAAVTYCMAQSVSCGVATPPDGVDPCEWLLQEGGRDQFTDAVGQAAEGFAFVLRRACGRYDLKNPGDKLRAAEAMMEIAASAPQPMVRNAYRQQIADRLDVPTDTLQFPSGRPARRQERVARADSGLKTVLSTRQRMEWELIGYCVHEPKLVRELLDVVALEELTEPAVREIAELLAQEENGALRPEQVLHCLDDERARQQLAWRLEVRPLSAELTPLRRQFERLLSEARRLLLNEQLEQARNAMVAAQEAGDSAGELEWLRREREIRLQIGGLRHTS